MEKSADQKIAAVVPALNEEKNVGEVLRVLLNSKFIEEVVLVDDGSIDRTYETGKEMGAKVIKIPVNKGKGNAMLEGIRATDAKIIIFFDADLLGLTEAHIKALADPMKEGIDMCVGVRGRFWNLPMMILKVDPLMAIGGERAVRKDIIESIPEKFMQGFAVETALNYYCLKNKKKVEYVLLKNLDIVTKERKWGFWKGVENRVKMAKEMAQIRRNLKNL